MTDKKQQKEKFEDMADKRASKPVLASAFGQQPLSNKGKLAPQTAKQSLSKQIKLLELDEEYFNKRKPSAYSKGRIEEEDKDDATEYQSIAENYLNYRSSSQPNKDFLGQDSTRMITPKSQPVMQN